MAFYDEWADMAVPGLEAIFQVSRNASQVSLNDRHMLEGYNVDSIDGLFDTPGIRESREGRPDDHGTDRGLQFSDEKVVAFSGTTFAGSFAKLREMQGLLSRVGGVEKPLTADGTLRIIPIDYFAKRKLTSGEWAVNWLSNPDFKAPVATAPSPYTDWAAFGTPTPTITKDLDANVVGRFQIGGKLFSWSNRCWFVDSGSVAISARNGLVGWTSMTPWNQYIPVQPGSEWILTGLLRVSTLTGTASVGLRLSYFDGSGGAQFDEDVDLQTLTGVRRSTVVSVAPDRARWMRPYFVVDGGASGGSSQTYLTDMMLISGSKKRHTIGISVPGARRPQDGVSPNVGLPEGHRPHNLFTNPTSTINATVLTIVNCTVAHDDFAGRVDPRRSTSGDGLELLGLDLGLTKTTDIAAPKRPGFVLTSVAAGNMSIAPIDRAVPIIEGVSYGYSCYLQSTSVERTCCIRLIYSDRAGGTLPSMISPILTQVAGKPLRLYWDHEAPVDAYAVSARMEVRSTGAAGEVHILSHCRMTVGSHKDEDYRDGDFPGWEWMGARGLSESQQRPPEPYVLEGVDVDTKQVEKQDSRDRKRPFMVTCKARDPRIYRERREVLDLISASTTNDYLAQANPGVFAASTETLLSDGTSTPSAGPLITNLGYTYIAQDVTAKRAAARVPTASVAGNDRFAQIHVSFTSSSVYAGLYEDYVSVIFRRTATNTRYEIRLNSGGFPQVYKWVSGVLQSGYPVLCGWSSYLDSPFREFWARVWVTNDNYMHLSIYFKRPGLNDVADFSQALFTDTGLWSAGGKFGWALGYGMFATNQSFRLHDYEEGDVTYPPALTGTAQVVGDFDTPPDFLVTGPAAFPYISVPASGISIFTDAVLSTGQTMAISSEGLVTSSNPAVTNKAVTSGSALKNLAPISQTINFNAQGLVSGQSKMRTTWRAAFK